MMTDDKMADRPSSRLRCFLLAEAIASYANRSGVVVVDLDTLARASGIDRSRLPAWIPRLRRLGVPLMVFRGGNGQTLYRIITWVRPTGGGRLVAPDLPLMRGIWIWI
jgi:hypothetical protein